MEPASNPLDLLRQRRAINRVEAAMRKTEEVPKPGGYRYLGRNADTGQGLVVGNDGSVIPGDIITSGHIKPGQSVRVAQAGGLVQLDQKPRVRKVVPPVAKKEEGGPVKILFSVVEGAERIYYVGGDRVKPKELFRLPSTTSATAHLVATGKGLNAFYWQYALGGNVVDGRSESPIAIPTGSLGYIGAGIFTALNTREMFVPEPPLDECSNRFASSTFRDFRLFSGESFGLNQTQSKIRAFAASTSPCPVTREGPYPDVYTTNLTDITAYSGSYAALGFSAAYSGAWDRQLTTVQIYTSYSTGSTTVSDIESKSSREETMLHCSEFGDFALLSCSLVNLIDSRVGVGNGVTTITPTGFNGTRYEASAKDGERVLLSEEAQSLIGDQWISPRYSSISGSSLYMLPRTVAETKEKLGERTNFLDFQAVDLSDSTASIIQAKTFPITKDISQIHSISYHP
jgi:hypothetical protein